MVTVLAIVLRVTMEIPVRTRVIVSTDPVELPGPVYVIKAGQDHSVTVFVPPGVRTFLLCDSVCSSGGTYLHAL